MFKNTPLTWSAQAAASNNPFENHGVPTTPKPPMSAANFPQHPITSGPDLQARLRMAAGLQLTTESVLTLRQQIVEHRNTQRAGQGEMGAGGATLRATDGILFGSPDLKALKLLRDFARQHGNQFSSTSTTTVFCSDFSALVIPTASSLFTQVAALENGMSEAEVSSQIEGNRGGWFAEQHMSFCSEVMDWTNGEKAQLTPETWVRLNALDAHHHHSHADHDINQHMLDASAGAESMVWETMTQSAPEASGAKTIFTPDPDWRAALLQQARQAAPQAEPSTSAATFDACDGPAPSPTLRRWPTLQLNQQPDLPQLQAPWLQLPHMQKMKGQEAPQGNPFMLPRAGSSVWAEMGKTDPRGTPYQKIFTPDPAHHQALTQETSLGRRAPPPSAVDYIPSTRQFIPRPRPPGLSDGARREIKFDPQAHQKLMQEAKALAKSHSENNK